ncbi:hypothetical protein, partial [Nocardia wallacei]|uniref:hypothetical protein n=1 Tax=Nocardia wallacei TaxID=480035 RepID=UPI003CC7D943
MPRKRRGRGPANTAPPHKKGPGVEQFQRLDEVRVGAHAEGGGQAAAGLAADAPPQVRAIGVGAHH